MEQGRKAGVRDQAGVWVRVVLALVRARARDKDKDRVRVRVKDAVAVVAAGEPGRAKDVEDRVEATVSFTKY
ncbi:MAG: hypothetical protein A4E55_01660 [Pelotomaculum sp. PtaU1.Bin035]|nr:MAG: hypothetical protein A4E55_01660 [Pelotomaculum sp. PtaU1.Bin035]